MAQVLHPVILWQFNLLGKHSVKHLVNTAEHLVFVSLDKAGGHLEPSRDMSLYVSTAVYLQINAI